MKTELEQKPGTPESIGGKEGVAGNAKQQDGKLHTRAEENDGRSRPEGEIEELGGVTGPEPTRYGDWEKNGRCIDF